MALNKYWIDQGFPLKSGFMSLRVKILLLLVLSGLTYILVIDSIVSRRLVSDFKVAEKKYVEVNNERIVGTLQDLPERLLEKQRDWASWDDTYEYLNDKNQKYITSNLTDFSVVNLKLNFIFYVDTDYQLVYFKALDAQNKELAQMPAIIKSLSADKKIINTWDPEKELQGIYMHEGFPWVIAAAPIKTSEGKGPVRGTIVWGYPLDTSSIDKVKSLTKIDFTVENFETFKKNHPKIIDGDHLIQIFENLPRQKQVYGYSLVRDIYGNPSLAVTTLLDNQLYERGKEARESIRYAMIGGILLIMGVVILLMHRFVIKRLNQMRRFTSKVISAENLSDRLDIHEDDEIGSVASAINHMLMTIEKSQNEIIGNKVALEKSNTDLINKIEEANKLNEELKSTQDQLLQSQKLESLGRLAGGIAHDFNNILGAIMGYLSVLNDSGELSPKSKNQVEIMLKASERGAGLTKQLLGFARKGKGTNAVMNLNKVVEETIQLISRSAQRNIEIKSRLDTQLKDINADSGQMLQVLMNLGVNAMDAMDKGGVLLFKTSNIELDSKNKKDLGLNLPDGNYAVVEVIDQGSGIHPQFLERIFDPFFTTKEVGKGTGLGLSLVHGIVKGCGGDVKVKSKMGTGTTFAFYMPALKSVSWSANEKAPDQNMPDESQFKKCLGGARVLVVEDELPLKKMVSDLFRSYGAIVDEAPNGMAALDMFHQNKYSLVCLDIVMPGIDGVDVLEGIRKTSQVPVIVFSGYSSEDSFNKIDQYVSVDFIPKPYRLQELLLMASKALST